MTEPKTNYVYDLQMTYIKKFLIPIAVVISTFVFGGCATIVKDDSQPVAFSSEPQGATVKINEIPRGKTPTTLMVKRDFGKQIVGFDLEGYHPIVFPLEKSIAGMTFGNILFGGIIGVGVDIATGKATNYEDSVHAIMTPLSEPKPTMESNLLEKETVKTSKQKSSTGNVNSKK